MEATEIIDQASQFTQFSQEPIVIQSTRPREVPNNQRYHKLHAVFQRFASRATQVSQNEFDKMLDSLTIITEMSSKIKLTRITISFMKKTMNHLNYQISLWPLMQRIQKSLFHQQVQR